MYKLQTKSSRRLKESYMRMINHKALRKTRFWKKKRSLQFNFLSEYFNNFRTKLQFWYSCLHQTYQKKMRFSVPKVVWLRRHIKIKFFKSIRFKFFKKTGNYHKIRLNKWFRLLIKNV